jgi:hypothetical protein
MNARPLDSLPLWVSCLATISVGFMSVEAGCRLGILRRRRLEPEKESSVGVAVAAAQLTRDRGNAPRRLGRRIALDIPAICNLGKALGMIFRCGRRLSIPLEDLLQAAPWRLRVLELDSDQYTGVQAGCGVAAARGSAVMLEIVMLALSVA